MGDTSTVARFIQRFREATPLSPDRRRRDRAAMEGEFWWTRSSIEDDFDSELEASSTDHDLDEPQSGETLDGAIPPTTSAEAAAAAADVNSHFSESHEDALRITTLKEKSVPDMPDELGSSGERAQSMMSQSVMRGLKALATTPPPDSPSSPGPPGPPLSDDGGDDLSLPPTAMFDSKMRYLVESQDRQDVANRCAHGASDAGDEDTALEDLDSRASLLLEHCRRLLAVPSTNLEQEDPTIQPIPVLSGENYRTDPERNKGFSNMSRGGVEQRAWILLDQNKPLEERDIVVGIPSKLHNHSSHTLPHQRKGVTPWESALRRQEEIDLGEPILRQCHLLVNGPARRTWSEEETFGGARGESRHSQNGDGLASYSVEEPVRELLAAGRSIPKAQRERDDDKSSWSGTEGFDGFDVDSAVDDSAIRLEYAFDRCAVREGDLGGCRRRCTNSADLAILDVPLAGSCSSAAPLWTGGSSMGSSRVRARAPTPTLGALADDFAADPVVAALVERAGEIEAEIEKRRSVGLVGGSC